MKKHGADSPPERAALLLSPEAPYPPAGGGALRTASLIEYLGRRYALDVIVFREPGAPDPRDAFPPGLVREAQVIDLPRHSKTPAARATRNLVRLASGWPPLNDRFRGFDREVGAALGERRYDLAVIEHFWCASYLDQVAPRAARVVLDLHNIESVLYRGLAQSEPWPASLGMRMFAAAARRLERRWLPRFAAVLVASPADAARIASQVAVRVYPNAIPAVSQPHVPEENILAFSGNLEYAPNVAAVRFFRREIWPLLRVERPDLRWRLIGKNPSAVAQYVRGDDRIEIIGPVENAIEALAAARVVVVPLLAGSGTRFKILEAWAAGRAVVSTTLGAEGLPARDEEHLLLRDTPEAFANAVSHLLASPDERRRLGAAGRALCDRDFTWTSAWEALPF
jgi:glycosyltransferase involved in cell wall biosynthesis